MQYVIFLEKAFEKEDKPKKPPIKKEEEDEKEEKLPPRKKGTDIGSSNVEVGHKILVGDGEDTEAEVTAVGQHGVTAKDSKGNKHQILHQHVKKQDGQDEDEEEDEDDDEKWGEDKKEKEGKESKSRKDESVTVEEFLKQEKWKTGEWIQASMLARLMETSLKDIKEQLLDLSNTGLVQLVSEDNLHGDLLYKFTNAKRAPHEAKATKVPSGRNEDTKFKQPGKNKK